MIQNIFPYNQRMQYKVEYHLQATKECVDNRPVNLIHMRHPRVSKILPHIPPSPPLHRLGIELHSERCEEGIEDSQLPGRQPCRCIEEGVGVDVFHLDPRHRSPDIINIQEISRRKGRFSWLNLPSHVSLVMCRRRMMRGASGSGILPPLPYPTFKLVIVGMIELAKVVGA